MALARVQTTGEVLAANQVSVNLTFPAPPTVGNAVVVLINSYRGSGGPGFPAGGVTDNRGNAYTQVTFNTNSSGGAGIYYCPKITGTGTPFTITFNSGASLTGFTASAIEVSGITTGLTVHRLLNVTGTSTTPSTGSTAPILASEVLVAAVVGCVNSVASVTVGVVAPAFTEEHEHITAGSGAVGEADTRIVTTAAGTIQSASWTLGTNQGWIALLAVFADSSIVVNLSQAPVEVAVKLDIATIDLRVSQLPLEVAVYAPNSLRVTQDQVEVISSPFPDVRVTQLQVETLTGTGTSADLRITQATVELLSENLIIGTTFETTQFQIIMP